MAQDDGLKELSEFHLTLWEGILGSLSRGPWPTLSQDDAMMLFGGPAVMRSLIDEVRRLRAKDQGPDRWVSVKMPLQRAVALGLIVQGSTMAPFDDLEGSLRRCATADAADTAPGPVEVIVGARAPTTECYLVYDAHTGKGYGLWGAAALTKRFPVVRGYIPKEKIASALLEAWEMAEGLHK